MWSFNNIMQRRHCHILRSSWDEYSRKILVAYSRPVERSLHRGPTADFLDRQPLNLVVVLINNLAGGILRGGQIRAKPGWPHGKGRYICLALCNGGFHRDDIAVAIETVTLLNGEVAIRVSESDRGGSGVEIIDRFNALFGMDDVESL